MGQRNATYIIVERINYEFSSKKRKKVIKSSKITPIYNQWNYIKMQPSKMVRGIKSILKMGYEFIDFGYVPIDLIYYINSGLSEFVDDNKKSCQWVGGNLEEEYYKNGTYSSAYQEDNNNGWNIVKIIIDNTKRELRVEIFCIPGSEDLEKANNKTLEGYFYEYINKKDIEYLSQFKWNPKLEKEAKQLILNQYNLIQKKEELV